MNFDTDLFPFSCLSFWNRKLLLSKQLLSNSPLSFLLISKRGREQVLSSSSEGHVQFTFSDQKLGGVYLISVTHTT